MGLLRRPGQAVLALIRRFDGVTARTLAEGLGIVDDAAARQRLAQILSRLLRRGDICAEGVSGSRIYYVRKQS